VPGSSSAPTASRRDGAARVRWTAPASDGNSPITGWTVTPVEQPAAAVDVVGGDIRAVNVPGLTNGTSYTFTVTAKNAHGAGAPSAASGPVTPVSTTALTLATSRSRILAGESFELSGTLTRVADGSPLAGAVIEIVGRHPSRPGTATFTATTDGQGRYLVTRARSYTTSFVARFAGTATDAGSVSSTRTVQVAPLVTVTSPASGSSSSTASPLVVTGKVAPNFQGQAAHLYQVRSDGTQVLLQTVAVDSTSGFRFEHALGAGSHRLLVRTDATPDNLAGKSAVFRVTRT
jgi:hypothetical protein